MCPVVERVANRQAMDHVLHSDSAEKALLGSLMIEPRRFAEIAGRVDSTDFFVQRNRSIFQAIQKLVESESPADLVLVQNKLAEMGELERAGGAQRLASLVVGVPRAANIVHYSELIRKYSITRSALAANQHTREILLSGNGDLSGAREACAEELEILQGVDAECDGWSPCNLEAVSQPDAGTVDYLIEEIVPRGGTVVIGAEWKVAKTLAAMSLALAVATRDKVFGQFRVNGEPTVAFFQLEMPHAEDTRRYRRLAVGMRRCPDEVPALAKEMRLLHYSRPCLDLTTPAGQRRFQRTVLDSGATLVIVDSLTAAFAGADTNHPSVARKLFQSSFSSLTSKGIAIVILHHRRKGQHGAQPGNDKDSLMGSQQWGAAADRVYMLSRAGKRTESDEPGEFLVRMALAGSWTPGQSEYFLRVTDTQDEELGEGTKVEVVTEPQQIRRGGVTLKQSGAIELAKMVRASGRIGRKKAFESLKQEIGGSDRTHTDALKYAKKKQWVTTEPAEGTKFGEVDLVPGELIDDA